MKRVEIFWQDTTSHTEWRCLHEARDLSPMEIKILGYLIEEKKNSITIASQVETTEDEHRMCADVHIIPRGCILSIKEI